MSKYENFCVDVGFSWLRMKSNFLLCQEYKHFSPFKHGKSRSAFLRKAAQWMHLVKTVAHCNISLRVLTYIGLKLTNNILGCDSLYYKYLYRKLLPFSFNAYCTSYCTSYF
jgi:hypothetical protein